MEICPALCGWTSDDDAWTGSATVRDAVKPFGASKLVALEEWREEVLYVLQSVRQEFAFSNRALVKVSADTSTTTRRLVERFEYKSNRVAHVRFESTGILYRDCVLEFCMGNTQLKLDIARDKEGEVKGLYKTLVLLGQKQDENDREWELVQQAVTSTRETVRLSGDGTIGRDTEVDESSLRTDASAVLQGTHYERVRGWACREERSRIYQDIIGTSRG
uniref:Bacterial Pleckstrin homology domain-containing protein n=1 Tax=Peronospora matthiolae TaxID=2874970 RepID=A0AAV1UJE1_9STRA